MVPLQLQLQLLQQDPPSAHAIQRLQPLHPNQNLTQSMAKVNRARMRPGTNRHLPLASSP